MLNFVLMPIAFCRGEALTNRPGPSSKNSHFENEAKCTTFLVKMSFICVRMKMISILKAEHLTSFWYRGPGELGNDILLVCTWRHGGHVDDQEPKHLSPLTKLHFDANSSGNNSVVLTTNMAALSRGCKPRISFPNSGRLMIRSWYLQLRTELF